MKSSPSQHLILDWLKMVTPITTSMMMMGDGDDHDVGHDDDDYDDDGNGNGTCLPRSYPLCPAQWPIANDPLTASNQLHILCKRICFKWQSQPTKIHRTHFARGSWLVYKWYTIDNCRKVTRPIFISLILQMLQRCQEIQSAACFWQETQSFSIMWHCCDIWDVSNIPNSTGFGISLTMYDISDANVTQWLVFSSSILWCVKYTKLDRSWHRHIYIYHMHILKVEDTSLKVRKAKFWSKIRNFLCLVSAFASPSHICA